MCCIKGINTQKTRVSRKLQTYILPYVKGLVSLSQSKSGHFTQWPSGILKHIAIGT
nr:MAG TPA: hypothetical protein [Bacteriophage sp.]DAY34957.1 MAG TPA: hypothetical protein [Bacteriophage sp.]